MSQQSFPHGTVVWAKVVDLPWWPAQVLHPIEAPSTTIPTQLPSTSFCLVRLINHSLSPTYIETHRLHHFRDDPFTTKQKNTTGKFTSCLLDAVQMAFNVTKYCPLPQSPITNRSQSPTPPQHHISNDFQVDTVLWARVEGFPWWPVVVIQKHHCKFQNLRVDDVPPHQVLVAFFNDNGRFSLVDKSRTRPFLRNDFYLSCIRNRGKYSKRVLSALRQAWSFIENKSLSRRGEIGQFLFVPITNKDTNRPTPQNNNRRNQASPVSIPVVAASTISDEIDVVRNPILQPSNEQSPNGGETEGNLFAEGSRDGRGPRDIKIGNSRGQADCHSEPPHSVTPEFSLNLSKQKLGNNDVSNAGADSLDTCENDSLRDQIGITLVPSPNYVSPIGQTKFPREPEARPLRKRRGFGLDCMPSKIFSSSQLTPANISSSCNEVGKRDDPGEICEAAGAADEACASNVGSDTIINGGTVFDVECGSEPALDKTESHLIRAPSNSNPPAGPKVSIAGHIYEVPNGGSRTNNLIDAIGFGPSQSKHRKRKSKGLSKSSKKVPLPRSRKLAEAFPVAHDSNSNVGVKRKRKEALPSNSVKIQGSTGHAENCCNHVALVDGGNLCKIDKEPTKNENRGTAFANQQETTSLVAARAQKSKCLSSHNAEYNRVADTDSGNVKAMAAGVDPVNPASTADSKVQTIAEKPQNSLSFNEESIVDLRCVVNEFDHSKNRHIEDTVVVKRRGKNKFNIEERRQGWKACSKNPGGGEALIVEALSCVPDMENADEDDMCDGDGDMVAPNDSLKSNVTGICSSGNVNATGAVDSSRPLEIVVARPETEKDDKTEISPGESVKVVPETGSPQGKEMPVRPIRCQIKYSAMKGDRRNLSASPQTTPFAPTVQVDPTRAGPKGCPTCGCKRFLRKPHSKRRRKEIKEFQNLAIMLANTLETLIQKLGVSDDSDSDCGSGCGP